MAHRGPDDTGIHALDRAWLGHQRLSIIDVSGGHQPLTDLDETVWIVGNGEIYNHERLTAALPDGIVQSKSDTEAALHTVMRGGPAAVATLNGMFAIAMVTADCGGLVARDPMGVKPLYWIDDADVTMFASELRAFAEQDRPRVEAFPPGSLWTPSAGLVRFAELLAREASKKVKVVLSGEGADELFAGYSYTHRRGRRPRRPARRAGAQPGAAARAQPERCDRTTMYDGLEAREPFLDAALGRLVRLGPYAPVRFEGDAVQFALRRLTRPGRPAAIASARASAEHSLGRLATDLVAPLGVDPDRPLVVVPARDTHRLPWGALHPAPVVVAPSATLWAATADRPDDATGRVVAVAGPGLPGAQHEVDVVGACHPGAVVLAPPHSTPDAVLDAIAGADLVHLACHGRLRADNASFSALEVTDGLVTVHELDLRGIAPHRVVLAARDSAADVSYDGGELIGFVGALLARGTVGLVAGVVAVGDVEAVGLMRVLHEGLAAGLTMSVALHAARAGMDLTNPRAFVNWCGFTAYGAG